MLKFDWTKKHTTILLYTSITIIVAVAVVLGILFPGAIVSFLKQLFKAISPVFYGFVIAYLTYPICRIFDKKVFSRPCKKKRLSDKAAHGLSVLATVLVVALIIALFMGMIVPQIKQSYFDLESRLDAYYTKTMDWVEDFLLKLARSSSFDFFFSPLDSSFLDGFYDVIESSFDILGKVTNRIVELSKDLVLMAAKIVMSAIFAVYFLIRKDEIFYWISDIAHELFPKKLYAGARKWISYTDHVFGNFISGKLLNALIITIVNFIVFGIAGIPYAPLVAVIIGVTDLIPYFGPFIGAIPSAFIILIADPIKVLWFVALVLIIQQIDGNLIGPRILGEKVGVDSLLVIVAITLSGSMFGIIGMFVGVPVFTVLYRAFSEFVTLRLEKKGLPTRLCDYGLNKKEAKK